MSDNDSKRRNERGAAAQLLRWQARLLPFIIAALVALAIFFFTTTVRQLADLNKAVAFQASPAVSDTLQKIEGRVDAIPAGAGEDLLKWVALVKLEQSLIESRYRQVNSTLLLRAWTRQLGFITGMLLAFVGSIFILARLSEERTELGGESGSVKATLSTSSPGVVLCTLGTVLMTVTLAITFNYETDDVAVYVNSAVLPSVTLPPTGSIATEIRNDARVMPEGPATR